MGLKRIEELTGASKVIMAGYNSGVAFKDAITL